MKKFLLKLTLFSALLFVADRAIGYLMTYFNQHSVGGYVAHHNYMNNEMQQELLVFGSSRAVHHYNSKMLEDSLGMSCYNCGQDGNGIILNYGQWLMIKKRYQPKMIIYDVTESFDMFIGEPDTKYLGWLKPYYDREGIAEIFDAVDKTERYKMMSMLYRNNSKFLQTTADFLHPIYLIDPHGFRPLDEEMDTMKIRKNDDKPIKIPNVDTLKINYLEKLVSDVAPTRIIFVISPVWYGMDEWRQQPIRSLCQKHDLTFLDFANNPKYVHNNLYFKDGSHLNARGADEFTCDLIVELKNVLGE